jgi:polysaccharide biosynthesis/export protein
MGKGNRKKEPGPRRRCPPSPPAARPWPFAFFLIFLSGCAVANSHVDRALLSDPGQEVRNQGVAENYHVGCPDLLQVTVAGRPGLGTPRPIAPDGRLDLGPLGRVRVEGLSMGDVARQIAAEAHLPPTAVRVHVIEYRSQKVYLFGEVTGLQRAVPYQGPETVLDLLRRTGGITPGAAAGEVHVVRSHVAEGRAPEVFHVDLKAVVMKHDERTNLRLQPFDQVYVGENLPSSWEKCVPPCFRPFYEAAWGLGRAGG